MAPLGFLVIILFFFGALALALVVVVVLVRRKVCFMVLFGPGPVIVTICICLGGLVVDRPPCGFVAAVRALVPVAALALTSRWVRLATGFSERSPW